MRKIVLIGIVIIMFFFKSSHADYEKVFFDFKIDGISGEVINFQNYKNKVVLMQKWAIYAR